MENQTTLEEYLLTRLDDPVRLANGSVVTTTDGHILTKTEAMAVNLIRAAQTGNVKAAQRINTVQMKARLADTGRALLTDMEHHLIDQLSKTAMRKNPQTGQPEPVTDDHDGHPVSNMEAITVTITNLAIRGDLDALNYINNLQARQQMQQRKK